MEGLICASRRERRDTDGYIDDRLQHQLAVVSKVIMPDSNHEGLWHWIHQDEEAYGDRRGAPPAKASMPDEWLPMEADEEIYQFMLNEIESFKQTFGRRFGRAVKQGRLK
jgi:hypothetical protein